jgi:hypothetical protein
VTIDQLAYVLKFPFRDEKWLPKVLVMSLLVLAFFIPVFPAVIFLGYLAVMMKRMIQEGKEPHLPEWSDWGGLFREGARVFGTLALIILPILVMFVLGYGAMVVPMFGLENAPPGNAIASIFFFVGLGVGFPLIGLSMLLGIVSGLFAPAVIGHVVGEGEFKAALRVREWGRIWQANWAGYGLTSLLVLGGGTVLLYGGQYLCFSLVLCCLFPFLMSALSAYLALVSGAMFAQAYRVGVEKTRAAGGD